MAPPNEALRRSDVIAALLAGFGVGALLVGAWLLTGRGASLRTVRVDPDSAVASEREIAATTDSARDGIIGQNVARIQRRLAATKLPTRPLTQPLRFRARDVRWLEADGRQFAFVATASGALDTRAVMAGDIVLRGVTLSGGDVSLVQSAVGAQWNYERVLAEILEGDGGADDGEGRRFAIDGLRISGTRVDVRLPDQRMTFLELDADASSVQLAGPALADPRLDIRRLSTTLLLHERDTRLALDAADAVVRIVDNGVAYDIGQAGIEGARLADVRGVWATDLPGYGVRATGRALDVRFADIRFIAPERIPETGVATFAFRIDPVTESATRIALSDIEATSGDSRVLGAVDAVVRADGFSIDAADLRVDPLSLALVEQVIGRELPYGGTLRGTLTGSGGDIRFDIDARLTSAQTDTALVTNVTGALAFHDAGFDLRNLVATFDDAPLAALRAVVPGLPLGGRLSGRIALNGRPDATPLDVDVRLEMGQGVFTVAGVVDLTGATPTYDVEGRIIGVQLQDVMTSYAPPAYLTARFTLDGRGVDPATAQARLSLGGRFTGWRAGPDDVVRMHLQMRDGAVAVDTLAMRLATLALSGAGHWRYMEPQAGDIDYDVRITSLEPWGPYLPFADSSATGSVRMRGSITGPLEAVRVAGTLQGDDLALGTGWSAASLEAEYQVELGRAVPQVTLTASAGDLVTPTSGEFSSLAADVRLAPPQFTLELTGQRAGATGNAIELAADGRIPFAGEREIVIQRAHLDLEDGLWRLSRPATIAWGGSDGLTVRGLEFRDIESDGVIALDGRILPLDRTDVTLDVARLPVAEVQRLLGREPVVTGQLWTSGTLRSLGTAPEVDLTFRLDSGAVMGVALAHTEGTVDYRGGALVTEAQVVFDTASVLDATLSVPFRFAVDDSMHFGLGDSGAIEGRIVARRVALAPFGALLGDIRDLAGYVTGEVGLGGTIDEPRLDGLLSIVDGGATSFGLNKRYEAINGTIAFAGERLIVQSLTAQAGGSVSVTGTVTLEELTNPVFDLTAEMTEFQVAGVQDEEDASLSGSVRALGPLEGLTVTGSVSVGDGAVLIPDMGGSTLDEEIFLAPGETFDDPFAPEANPFLDNLAIDDLRIAVERDTWFVLEDQARIQLGGDLVVDKSGDDWRVVGELEGERGTYTLAAGPVIRQFDISYARLRFQDETELNPNIEIIATRTIIDQTGRPVDIDVNIGGTMQEPTLALASGNAANVPQSELLSFLFFGQPSFALGGTGVASEAFVGNLFELGSIALGDAFGDVGLGLDVFQIRVGGYGGAGENTAILVVGRELTSDVFLTVESYLNGLFGESSTGLDQWALRLEWAFDPRSSLRAGIEPVNSTLLLRGVGVSRPTAPGQQFAVELRRRWVY